MWQMFIQFIVTFVASMLLAPKPQIQNAKPSNLTDFDFPTASDRPIPVIWGTVRQRGVNTLWYGDFEAKPITQKVKTGLFSSKRQTIGHKYHVGMQLALGFGPIDEIQEIWFGEELAWKGNLTSGRITIDKPSLYGGDSPGNNGGVSGDVVFYNGSDTQGVDPYLSNHAGADNVSGFPGIAYLVFEHFYVGNSTNMKPISVVCKRLAKSTDGSTQYEDVHGDSNPSYMNHELMTNQVWGGEIAPSLINTASFESAAATLHAEGMGMSYTWDSPRSYKEIISEFQRHTDGYTVENPTTGLIEFKLIRNDYNVDDLPVLDDSVVIDVKDYNRGTLTQAHTEVRVKYMDRESKFAERHVTAQNLGARIEKREASSVTAEYMGFTRAEVAQYAAERDLIPLSMSLAQMKVVCNRLAYDLGIGDPVVFNWPEMKLDRLVMRVTDIDVGSLDDNKVTLALIQDAFGFSSRLYSPPAQSGWQEIVKDPVDLSTVEVIETPILYRADPQHPTGMTMAENPKISGVIGYRQHSLIAGETDPIEGGRTGFTPTGILTAGINATATTLRISGTDLDQLTNSTSADIRTGENLIYIAGDSVINSEWLAFESVTYDEPNNEYVLSGLWRGLIDTLPKSHASGLRVWFPSYEHDVAPHVLSNGDNLQVKLLSETTKAMLHEDNATQHHHVCQSRYAHPAPPARVNINGQGDGGTITNQATVWFYRRDNGSNYVVKQSDNNQYGSDAIHIEIYDDQNNLIRTATKNEDNFYTFDDELSLNNNEYFPSLRFKVWSDNGLRESHQRWDLTVTRNL